MATEITGVKQYQSFVGKLSIATKLEIYRVLLSEGSDIPEPLLDIGMALVMDTEVQTRLNLNVGGRHG